MMAPRMAPLLSPWLHLPSADCDRLRQVDEEGSFVSNPKGESFEHVFDRGRVVRLFNRADADGDGAVDFNELFTYVQPARNQKRAGVEPVTRLQKVLTPAAALLQNVAAHIASDGLSALTDEAHIASDGLSALTDEAHIASDGLSALTDEAEDEAVEGEEDEGMRWKRVAAATRRKRREEAAAKAFAAQAKLDADLARQADDSAARALSTEYITKLQTAVMATVAAGYPDHTRTLSPEALQRLYCQIQRHDTSGTGRLHFADFERLCRKVMEHSNGVELTRLQLLALFSQADATGQKSLCASQWCRARAELALMLAQQAHAQQVCRANDSGEQLLALTYSATAAAATAPRFNTF
jgi:hypothetical protein